MPHEPTRLAAIAHGRSGDKGNHANIAVIAYTPAGFAWLREHLTVEMVANTSRRWGRRRWSAMKCRTSLHQFCAAECVGGWGEPISAQRYAGQDVCPDVIANAAGAAGQPGCDAEAEP